MNHHQVLSFRVFTVKKYFLWLLRTSSWQTFVYGCINNDGASQYPSDYDLQNSIVALPLFEANSIKNDLFVGAFWSCRQFTRVTLSTGSSRYFHKTMSSDSAVLLTGSHRLVFTIRVTSYFVYLLFILYIGNYYINLSISPCFWPPDYPFVTRKLQYLIFVP